MDMSECTKGRRVIVTGGDKVLSAHGEIANAVTDVITGEHVLVKLDGTTGSGTPASLDTVAANLAPEEPEQDESEDSPLGSDAANGWWRYTRVADGLSPEQRNQAFSHLLGGVAALYESDEALTPEQLKVALDSAVAFAQSKMS